METSLLTNRSGRVTNTVAQARLNGTPPANASQAQFTFRLSGGSADGAVAGDGSGEQGSELARSSSPAARTIVEGLAAGRGRGVHRHQRSRSAVGAGLNRKVSISSLLAPAESSTVIRTGNSPVRVTVPCQSAVPASGSTL